MTSARERFLPRHHSQRVSFSSPAREGEKWEIRPSPILLLRQSPSFLPLARCNFSRTTRDILQTGSTQERRQGRAFSTKTTDDGPLVKLLSAALRTRARPHDDPLPASLLRPALHSLLPVNQHSLPFVAKCYHRSVLLAHLSRLSTLYSHRRESQPPRGQITREREENEDGQ